MVYSESEEVFFPQPMFIRDTMNKKGFLTVEAAIFLPVFILAMLSLICLIRIIGIETDIMRIYSDAAQKTSKEAYITQLDIIPQDAGIEVIEGIIHGTAFEIRLMQNIREAYGNTVYNVRLNNFRYLYESRGTSGIISGNLAFKTDIPLPMSFGRTLVFEERLTFRGFIGSSDSYEPMEYIRMEQEEDADIAYVFPRAGEKYHKRNCRVIEVYPEEVLLSDFIRREYYPCRLCSPSDLTDGCKVYCFTRTGRAYHKGSCTLVDRYVIPVLKEKAVSDGYDCCSLCGG